MGRASAAKSSPDRRQKIEDQRAAAQRRRTRNRLLTAGGAVSAVVAIIVVLAVVKATSSSNASAPPVDPTGKALSRLIATTTSVPAATLEKVGAGTGSSSKLVSIAGHRLTRDGKPEVVYVGAEYCPYCAAERWSMIVALNRFGTFTGLATTHSSAGNGAGTAEPYAYTRSWTFAGARYTSKYLSFTSAELNTNAPDKATGGYVALQSETPAEQALLTKYDAPPYVPSGANGSIPFVDFANKYLSAGSSFDPAVLSGLSWTRIATDLHNPSSHVAKAVLGTANYITAALCGLTGNHPMSACTPQVRRLQHNI